MQILRLKEPMPPVDSESRGSVAVPLGGSSFSSAPAKGATRTEIELIFVSGVIYGPRHELNSKACIMSVSISRRFGCDSQREVCQNWQMCGYCHRNEKTNRRSSPSLCKKRRRNEVSSPVCTHGGVRHHLTSPLACS